MKKRITIVCAAILFMFIIMFTVSVSAYDVGDVDGSGKITASDARLTLRAAALLDELDGEQQKAADVDFNGRITAGDARFILRVSARLDEFEIPEIPETTKPVGSEPVITEPPVTEHTTEEPATIEPSTDASSLSNQEILDTYCDVVHNLKENVSQFSRKNWEVLGDYDLGIFGNTLDPIIRGIITSEEDAEERILDDPGLIPVINDENAVYTLTGDDLKEASLTEKNGKTTVVFVLKDEKIPYPSGKETSRERVKSRTDAVFGIVPDNMVTDLEKQFGVYASVKKMSYTYYDCTVTLVYDTNTLKVESVERVRNVKIDVDMKALFSILDPTISGYAYLTNATRIYDIAYKKPGSGQPEPTTPAPLSNQEILDKYSEVVKNLKDNVLEYRKKEWQVLDDDYDLGTRGTILFPIANSIITSEEYAEEQIRNDREQIPVIRNENAVLPPLTGDDIKKASLTEKNGKTTIVIVLKDEVDPNPAEYGAERSPSKIGAMFNPVSMDALDDIISRFDAYVKVKKLSLTYHDCTATLVYDTNTLAVESLEQVMNIHVDVDMKVLVNTVSGYAGVSDVMKIYDVSYK